MGDAEWKLRKILVWNLVFAVGGCTLLGGLIYGLLWVAIAMASVWRLSLDNVVFMAWLVGTGSIFGWWFIILCASAVVNLCCLGLSADEAGEWVRAKGVEHLVTVRIATWGEVLQCTRQVLNSESDVEYEKRLRAVLESNLGCAEAGMIGLLCFLAELLMLVVEKVFEGAGFRVGSAILGVVAICCLLILGVSFGVNGYCMRLVECGRGDEVRLWAKTNKLVEPFLALRLGTREESLHCTREVLNAA